jgi:undecaprenyl-diphosphatase
LGFVAQRQPGLLSIPAILGAGVLKIIQAFSMGSIPAGEWAGLLLGALTAGAVGALAIKGLLAVIARGRLKVFGIYCLVAGASALIYSVGWPG